MHYQKADGSWADIDTAVVQQRNGRWQEAANAQMPDFAPNATDKELVSWSLDADHKVSYGLQGAANSIAKASGSTLTYPGAAKSTDVEYDTVASGVKEVLLLHDASAPTSWTFPLQLAGLTPALDTAGNVVFKDGSGRVRLTIPHGFMADSAVDPKSHEGAISDGVSYQLTTVDGQPALQMNLDGAWLHDPHRVFPIRVDPSTGNVNAGQSTYVMSPFTANYSSDSLLKVGTYDGGSHVANSYLYFPVSSSALQYNYVESVGLALDNVWSYSCSQHEVDVQQITSDWNASSINTYPGVSLGNTIGVGYFGGGTSCNTAQQGTWESIDLGDHPSDAGSQLVNSWAWGGTNSGLAVTASSSDTNAWKQFASVNTSNPPYLYATYADWAASYSIAGSYVSPTATASGSQQVTLTNLASNWWNSTSMQLKARIFDTSGNEQSFNAPFTNMPGTVKTGDSVTVTGVIPPLPTGNSYVLCWDGYVNGSTSLHDAYGVPWQNCFGVAAQNMPPQIDTMAPASGTVVGALSPQFYATGHDPDNYPGTGLDYDFRVYSNPSQGSPQLLAESGWQSSTSWAVPVGTLAWNQNYLWNVKATDHATESPLTNYQSFTTTVQQPLITSRMGGDAGNGTTRAFDPQAGNYTTSATDATVKAVGPALSVTRSYNSLDSRTANLFGAGWSSAYDMSVIPDGDSTGSVVVTTANGRTERFGRNDFLLTHLTGIGDQTGDGVDDAVAIDSSTGQLWLYPGPDFSATKRKLVGNGGWTNMSQLTGADVTGDGIGDLVAVQPSDGTLWLYPGVAGGGFNSRVMIGSGGWSGMTSLAITPSLVGDSHKDLVATEISTGYLYAYPFNADGTLGSRVMIGTGGWNGMTNLIGGDFNHDGKGDVVAVETSTGKLWLYPGGASTSLNTSTLGNRTQIGWGWNTMRDLAAVNGAAGDAGTDVIAVDKATGVQYLYHSATQWSGTTKTTTGMALYTSPAGEFETLAATAGGGGWVLADKTGTVYTFGQPSGAGYLLSKITDREQHSQLLHYTSGKLDTVTDQVSGRALHVTWTADGRHVAQVATDPVTGTDQSTALTWTYSYDSANADELVKVCAPPTGTNTTRPCTTYTYTPGSHLRSTVMDANPASYWRLGEASGTTANSEVIANQGIDKGTYSNITLGSTGPLTGSATTAATFNGTTSSVTLPNASLRNTYLAIGLWFKTTSPGVLVAYQDTALGTKPASSSAPLYIGADGKLRGEFYGPAIGVNPITSTGTVTDGSWHFAVLSGAGDNQTLYLDGALVGSLSGVINHLSMDYTYLGAGYTADGQWPSEPAAGADGTNRYAGQMAEVALYAHALGSPAVASQWAAGRNASAELTNVALPSGKTKLAATYDTIRDSASQITDANGGTWNLSAPTVSGSEQEYRSSVLGSRPSGYWRLSESGAVSQAVNTISVPRPTPNNGTYSNVALGGSGPMTGSSGAAGFDGATSWAEIPAAFAPSAGPGAIGVWFKTSTAGVLVSYQSFPIGTPAVSGLDWNPALYVGTDGLLHGELWAGTAGRSLVSTATVTDNKWHFAALSAETPTSQSLYLDGQLAAGPLNAAIHPNGQAHVYIGAGAATGWAAAPTDPAGHFNGQIADVVTFNHGIGSKIADLYHQATANGSSAYDVAVVDDQPTGYWRMNDTSGNEASELLSSAALAQNQGTYNNVTLGTTGPYASGGTTAASFNGTTSQVQLPATAVPRTGGTASVEVWFKTASPGVIYGYQSFPLGASHTGADWWNPALYVGTDGMLHGQLWNGSGANTAVSAKAVNDNTWHMATLVASGSGSGMSQQLYIDGQPSGNPVTGLTRYCGDAYAYLGAGTDNGSPKAPSDISGHFNGQIADFSYYPYAMSASSVANHYTAATGPVGESVSQSAAYRSAVTLTGPSAYWRLDEPAGATSAQDELGTALPNQEHGTYTNTTLGATGPSGATDGTAATFNGTTSSVQLPATAAAVQGPNTIELWFKTTASGTLYGYQSFPLGAAHTNSDSWNPALYVGSDGKLYGDLWTGDASTTLNSSQTVNDGKWHHAVLAGDDSGQTLYLDGTQAAASTTARQVYYNGSAYVYVGAGTADGGWPNHPTSTDGHFNGSIAEVAFYKNRLDAGTVSAHYKSMGSASSPTKITYSSVTAPSNYNLSWRWDTATGQLTSIVDPNSGLTRYTYDTHGYVYSVTDPDGHTVTTGHDDRGNTVSTTTCTDAAHCHTAYASYYLDTANPFDPANDKLTSSSDARSSGPSDSTYTTRYTYNSAGDLTSTSVPATPDFPNGRVAYTTQTAGSEQAVNSSGQPTIGSQPSGLAATHSVTVDAAAYPQASGVPASQQDRYWYNAAGDLTKTVSPLGLTTTFSYDNLGRVTSKTQACTNCGPGQTATSTTTTFSYDGQGNQVSRTDPSTTDAVTGTVHTGQTSTAYDADGNITSQTVSDTTGGDKPRTSTYTYDPTNHVQSATDPAGRKTTYSYDSYGNVTGKTDAAGTNWLYVRDPLGQLIRTGITNYTGSPNSPVASRLQILEARAYDPAGRLATITDAMGRTTHTYYNDDNTVAEVDLDGYHNTDGTTRNVVLQQNTYDAAGQLSQQITGGGKTTTTSVYDAAGRLSSTTLDPGGLNRSTTYGYDANSNVTVTKLAGNGQTAETDLSYDAAGDPLTKTVKNTPQNSRTTYTYDQHGLPLTETSPNGNVTGATPAAYTTTYAHDPLGRLTTTIAPTVTTDVYNTATQVHTQQQTAPIATSGYDTFGDLTAVDDPNGSITTYTYDAVSQRTAVSHNTYLAPGTSTAITPTTTVQYDALGHPTTTTVDPTGLNRVTTTTYDQLGNPVKITQPAVGGTTPTWLADVDLDGEMLQATDPTGAVAQATYDDLGRQATASQLVRQPAPNPTVAYTTTYSYDDAGNLTATTDPNNHTNTTSYNAANELTSATDALNNTTQYTHDLLGNLTRTTLPDGTAATTTFDQAGHATGVTHFDHDTTVVTQTSAGYDADGNRTSATDANGHTTTYTFDATDRLTQQVEPVTSTASITASFGHDAAGNRTRYTHTRQTGGTPADVYYTYNTLELPESTIEPPTSTFPNAADRTYTLGYNAAQELVTDVAPGGVVKTNAYSSIGQLTSQTGIGAQAATTARTFGYDLVGRLTSVSAGQATSTYTYDDRGLITSQGGTTGSATFGYDATGNMTTRTDRAGTTTFGYDPDNRLATLTDPLTNSQISYHYNNVSELTSEALGSNAATRTFTYDPLQRITNDTVKNPSGTTEASVAYGYDNDGHLTSKTTTGVVNSSANTYTYDWAGRLTSWNNGTSATNYGYDNDGNLTQSGANTTTFDDRDRRIASGTTTYTYDARGTLTCTTNPSGTTNTVYDAFDQLASNGPISYTYDALGRLATAGTSTFTYDRTSDNITYDGAQTYNRDPAGNLVALTTTKSAALAFNDHHNDLVATYTPTGTTLNGSTSFDPWGKNLGAADGGTGIGYQGGWTDPNSHLLNTASRWYDPSTGAFTSRDTATLNPTTAARANRYAYTSGHPLDATDPSGHREMDVGGDGAFGAEVADGEWAAKSGESTEQLEREVQEEEQANELREQNKSEEQDHEWQHEEADRAYEREAEQRAEATDNGPVDETPTDTWTPDDWTPTRSYTQSRSGRSSSAGTSEEQRLEAAQREVAQREAAQREAVRRATNGSTTNSRPTGNDPASTEANNTIVHPEETTSVPGDAPTDPVHVEATANPETVRDARKPATSDAEANGPTPSYVRQAKVPDTAGRPSYAYQKQVTGRGHEDVWNYEGRETQVDGVDGDKFLEAKWTGKNEAAWKSDKFYNPGGRFFDESKVMDQAGRLVRLNGALGGSGVRYIFSTQGATNFYRALFRDWFPEQMENGFLTTEYNPGTGMVVPK
ncbi:LamG-like jellyroll fold domain-containing protein [Kitasatospora sp. GP82]|uniref:LamG-like jellyroll fold domain-containing protein n=1 Tax=Kitasatospora sp. GP82 TaxID=3035089 RepID=UPI002473C73A|nr:LamG-like jellyroll fold domain-containing protein [Kitasatospora sp. GP82]